ncbi:MAG: hypothetical protein ACXACU_17635 [Candidatus Hodarchaeales archaeon]|jgi:hypothetical protein
MNQNQLSQQSAEDRLFNFVHEQLKLNIVIDVLNYNGPISEQLTIEDDIQPKSGVTASVVSSAF